MINDTHRHDLPPPTAKELLVVEHVLYRCLHRDTARSKNRDRMHLSTCMDCAEYQILGFDYDVEGLTDADIALIWLRELPRPATHLFVAETALAEVRRCGWEDQFLQSASVVTCKLTKGERVVRSEPMPTRAQAIVEAIAKIAVNYKN